ncbi:MAG: ATP-binding protein [Bdellovibrionota bacterium]
MLKRKKQQKKSVNSLWSNAMPWYGPALFFIFTIILLAGLIFVVLDQAEQEKNDHLLSDISSTEENITDRLIGIRDYLILLSEEYLDERLDEIKFRAKSERFLIERSEIVSISFVDNEGIRQWVIPESKEHFEGTSLLRPNLLKAFEEAGESGHPIFSLPFISFKGESVVNLHVPVSNQKEVLGVIAAQISLKLLVENATYRPLREKYMITLEDDTGRTFISLKSLNQVESQFSESVPLSTMDGNISLSFTKYKTPVNWIIVILTVLCIGLICSLVWTMLTIGRDNFLRKQVQIQLEKAKKEAERANRAKSELIANISHEIRTPLGIIQGCTDLLHIYNNSEAEKEGLVKTIKRNSTCLLELVNDLLDLSKIEAGLLEIEKNGVSLRGLISSVHALFKASFEQKGIALIFNFKGSVPKEINTDANRLRQILINLIGNALKFTEKGQVSVDIQVLKNNEGEKASSTILEISVCDTGIGMNELQKTKLFSPFSQGDSSISRNYGGSGLGLALSAKLARMLDGSIKLIASTPGKGSEFRLILLLDEYASDKELFLEPLDGNLQLDEYDKDSPSTYSLAGCTVLIVEDCLDNQRIYARFLEFAGAHVLIAGSGVDALEYANGFDGVILMDIQMPKMDGYETTRCMRKIGFRGLLSL